MIYGFEIALPDGGTKFGVITSRLTSREVLVMVAEASGVPNYRVRIVDAEDMIEDQYEGLAYLSTGD